MPTFQLADDDHIRGASGAPTTILVYGDYECPHTRALELVLTRLRRLEPDAFRSIFRHFPLREIHPHAQMAAQAAEAVFALAGADAFWIMHDGLFAHQDQLDPAGLDRRGAEAGVESTVMREALDTGRYAPRVDRDIQSGVAIGVHGTPTVFINGERYTGARDVPSLRAALTTRGEPLRGQGQ